MRDHWQPAVNRLRSALQWRRGLLIVDMATAPGLRSPHVSIRAQTAPTVVHLTRNLSPPIGAQRLRGPDPDAGAGGVPLPGCHGHEVVHW